MGDIGLEPEPGEKILPQNAVHRVVDRVGAVDVSFRGITKHGQSQIRGCQLLNVQLEGGEKTLDKELEHFCLRGGEPDFVVRGVPDDVELAGNGQEAPAQGKLHLFLQFLAAFAGNEFLSVLLVFRLFPLQRENEMLAEDARGNAADVKAQGEGDVVAFLRRPCLPGCVR